MKKLISLISAFAVAAFGAVPVISAGEDGGYSFEYSVNDSGTAVITGGTGSGSVLNIPAQIDGLTVTEIGEQAFSGLGSLSTVILPRLNNQDRRPCFHRLPEPRNVYC